MLDAVTVREVGDVKDKKMLHLQCHIGSDTLSWALLGANVTGVDFSPKSLEIAEKLARECGINARWIESDIESLPLKLFEKFDIVVATQGIFCWVSDIGRWMHSAAHFLALDGTLYIQDGHPFMNIFEYDEPDFRMTYSYFNRSEPTNYGFGDYSDPHFQTKHPSYEWSWSLSDIINAVLKAGLKIEFLHEFSRAFWKVNNDFVKDSDGWWLHPKYVDKLPMTFSLKARVQSSQL